ncbi:MAG: phosphoribosylanthranilate isomerase [Clostridium sp.]
MTRVKICGIKELETIRAINNLNIDGVGLVFAKSKREISLERARILTDALRSGIERIGVFVNEDINRINYLVNALKLDFVQLHGDEDASYISKVNCRVMKAFSINEESDLIKIDDFKNVQRILLDAKCEVYRGGEGKAFDWNVLRGLKREHRDKLVLAGGLNSTNVRDAIKLVNPYMVDVSSGVEINNTKSICLIENFIEKVKGDKNGRV